VAGAAAGEDIEKHFGAEKGGLGDAGGLGAGEDFFGGKGRGAEELIEPEKGAGEGGGGFHFCGGLGFDGGMLGEGEDGEAGAEGQGGGGGINQGDELLLGLDGGGGGLEGEEGFKMFKGAGSVGERDIEGLREGEGSFEVAREFGEDLSRKDGGRGFHGCTSSSSGVC
jgi:hypothetical protein